jgi:hydroxyacylglutathione hydrolase
MADQIVFERLIVGPLDVNCYLFGDAGTRDAVCIDPGDEARYILDAVRRHCLTVRAVLITHAHADHILAAHEVSTALGVPVLAPDGEQELWEMASEFCTMWGYNVPQPPPPDRWITAGDPVDLGGVHLDTLDVRGHSPAGLAYLAPGTVFVGDALFEGNIGRTDLPGQDHDTLIDRIRRNLLSLPARTVVCPGHGSETTVGQEARWNPYLNDH